LNLRKPNDGHSSAGLCGAAHTVCYFKDSIKHLMDGRKQLFCDCRKRLSPTRAVWVAVYLRSIGQVLMPSNV